jgi:hypothetical protein
MDDNDSESELLEIVLVLKSFVGGHQNVALGLCTRDEFCVREGAPFGFGDGQDLPMGERLTQVGIDALV